MKEGWLVCKVVGGRDLRAASILSEAGYRTLVLTGRQRVRPGKGACSWRPVPAFPRFVFVWLPASYTEVFRLKSVKDEGNKAVVRYVLHTVDSNGDPRYPTLSNDEMLELEGRVTRFYEDQAKALEPKPFRAGERVRPNAGPLAFHPGEILVEWARTSNVSILYVLLGRQFQSVVAADTLERVNDLTALPSRPISPAVNHDRERKSL